MKLGIAQRAYEMELVNGPIVCKGQTFGSLCDHRRRKILISDSIPSEMRLKVAALAVSEAWEKRTIQRPPLKFVGDVE